MMLDKPVVSKWEFMKFIFSEYANIRVHLE